MADQEWRDVGALMDTLLAHYLDGQASFEETRERLATLWRNLLHRQPGANREKPTFPSYAVILVDHFTRLMEGRTRAEMERGGEVLRAAMTIAHGGPIEGTA